MRADWWGRSTIKGGFARFIERDGGNPFYLLHVSIYLLRAKSHAKPP